MYVTLFLVQIFQLTLFDFDNRPNGSKQVLFPWYFRKLKGKN